MQRILNAVVAATLIGLAVAENYVAFDIQGTHPAEAVARRVKRASINAPLSNFVELYTINATIGTPPQLVFLQLDTGSTDLWVDAVNSALCSSRGQPCNTPFDPSKSSTYKLSHPGEFSVQYGDGTGASGDFFTDVVAVGGSNVVVQNQTIGLASKSDIPTGLMGVGMPDLEGSCTGIKQGQATYCYPTIIDQMVSQSHINSRAFSLFLNDLGQSTGQIIFGGVDSARYSGDLISMPIIPLNVQTANQRVANAFYNVAWTNFTVTTPKGVQTNFWSDSDAAPVLLDSGTSFALFPPDLTHALYAQMGAIPIDRSGDYAAPCYLRATNITFDFYFGGPQGAVLRVPISEFLINWDSRASRTLTDLSGNQYCLVGFQPSPDGQLILGDTVLRSGYFVYDMDNRQIAIAQANFQGGKPNIKEITNATTSNIPGVTRTASQVTAISAVSSIASLSAIQPGQSSLLTATGLATGTTTVPTSAIPFAQFTTAKYTGQNGYQTPATVGVTSLGGSAASTGGTSATSSGAAGLITVSEFSFQSMAVSTVVGLFLAIGAGIFWM